MCNLHVNDGNTVVKYQLQFGYEPPSKVILKCCRKFFGINLCALRSYLGNCEIILSLQFHLVVTVQLCLFDLWFFVFFFLIFVLFISLLCVFVFFCFYYHSWRIDNVHKCCTADCSFFINQNLIFAESIESVKSQVRKPAAADVAKQCITSQANGLVLPAQESALRSPPLKESVVADATEAVPTKSWQTACCHFRYDIGS